MESYDKKLEKILLATGWSQETLAEKLGTSFVSLNSWINGKSEPRQSAKDEIDLLFSRMLGKDSIDKEYLKELKKEALKKTSTPKKILEDRELLEKLTTSFVYHSCAAEGSAITEGEVSAVIFDNKVLKNRTANEQREIINTETALYFLLNEIAEQGKSFEFTEDLIKSAHLRLMNGISSEAGHFCRPVSELIENWCEKVNEETTDKIALLASSNAEFERISPFADGNSCIGRLMLFILALKLDLVPPILKKERHLAYLKYLELAKKKELTDPLEQLIAESIFETAELFAFTPEGTL